MSPTRVLIVELVMFSWNKEQKKRAAQDPKVQQRMDAFVNISKTKLEDNVHVPAPKYTNDQAYYWLHKSMGDNAYIDKSAPSCHEPGSFVPTFNVPPTKNN